MISNKDKAIEIICNYISDYINNCNQKNLLIIDEGRLTSWFTIKIAEIARQKCGSEIYWIKSSLNIPGFHIAKQISFSEINTREEILNFCSTNSCIILSQLIRNDARIYRDYHKHNQIADLYPIIDLYFSELKDLSKHIGIENNLLNNLLNYNKELYSDEYEYCYKEDEKNSIITNNELPIRNKEWFKYTKKQKELIAKLHQREKISRHKDIMSRGFVYPSIRIIS